MHSGDPSPVPRRTFLAGAVCALGALVAACGDDGGSSGAASSSTTVAGSTAATTGSTLPATTATTAPAEARFVVAGPATKQRVALTFHTNGDLGLADQLLDVLDQHHTKI